MTAEKSNHVGVREHSVSTMALCMCSLINAYLQISVFPYAGYMVMHLIPGITQDSVGTRAGLLASSFMVGRSLSAYSWGTAADIYGRTFVLQSCLLLSSLFSVLFGTSRSFALAMLWRFGLGMSNGIIGAAKTAATELAYGDRTLERRAMGLVMGMRSWGYLISPALGGLLAEPLRQYPDARWLQREGWINDVLSTNPYIVPNLLAAIVCIVIAVVLQYCMHETLPENKRRHFVHFPADVGRFVFRSIQHTLFSIHGVAKHSKTPDNLESRRFLESPSDGDVEMVTQAQEDADSGTPETIETPSARSIWNRLTTREHMIAHWCFAFVSMMGDEAFPLFCMSRTGGLSLTEKSIGKVLSGAGVFFAISQYAVFSTLVNRVGEYTSMNIGSILGLQPSLLIPLSLLLNRGIDDGVSWGTFCLLSFSMGACKLFSCLYFTSLALALNKTVPDSQRATMNGFVVVGASVARAIAPTLAGSIATFSFSSSVFPSRYGSILLYSVISCFGALVCIRTWKLRDTPAFAVLEEAPKDHTPEGECCEPGSEPEGEIEKHEHAV